MKTSLGLNSCLHSLLWEIPDNRSVSATQRMNLPLRVMASRQKAKASSSCPLFLFLWASCGLLPKVWPILRVSIPNWHKPIKKITHRACADASVSVDLWWSWQPRSAITHELHSSHTSFFPTMVFCALSLKIPPHHALCCVCDLHASPKGMAFFSLPPPFSSSKLDVGIYDNLLALEGFLLN